MGRTCLIVGEMFLSPAKLVLFCAALVGASPGRQLQDESPPPPLWRKLQAKMNIEFRSKNTASELEPCKSEVFQESLKGLSLEEKKAKIDAAISEIEAKKKKKIALIIHEDCKSMYDEFCAKDGPKASSEICTNAELSSYLNSPLQLPSKRNV